MVYVRGFVKSRTLPNEMGKMYAHILLTLCRCMHLCVCEHSLRKYIENIHEAKNVIGNTNTNTTNNKKMANTLYIEWWLPLNGYTLTLALCLSHSQFKYLME